MADNSKKWDSGLEMLTIRERCNAVGKYKYMGIAESGGE